MSLSPNGIEVEENGGPGLPAHHCHFPGCRTHTPRKLLYCPPHWFMVPIAIRRRVWAAYNALPHGSEGNCLRVSKEWIDAVHAAEAAIKAQLAARNVEPLNG